MRDILQIPSWLASPEKASWQRSVDQLQRAFVPLQPAGPVPSSSQFSVVSSQFCLDSESAQKLADY
jgi:hypothetical protein